MFLEIIHVTEQSQRLVWILSTLYDQWEEIQTFSFVMMKMMLTQALHHMTTEFMTSHTADTNSVKQDRQDVLQTADSEEPPPGETRNLVHLPKVSRATGNLPSHVLTFDPPPL